MQASIQTGSVNISIPRPERFSRHQRGTPRICPLLAFGELTRSEGRLLVSTSTALNAHLLLFVGLSLQPKARESWDRLDRCVQQMSAGCPPHSILHELTCSKGRLLVSTSTALNAHLLLFVGLSLQARESWGRLDR